MAPLTRIVLALALASFGSTENLPSSKIRRRRSKDGPLSRGSSPKTRRKLKKGDDVTPPVIAQFNAAVKIAGDLALEEAEWCLKEEVNLRLQEKAEFFQLMAESKNIADTFAERYEQLYDDMDEECMKQNWTMEQCDAEEKKIDADYDFFFEEILREQDRKRAEHDAAFLLEASRLQQRMLLVEVKLEESRANATLELQKQLDLLPKKIAKKLTNKLDDQKKEVEKQKRELEKERQYVEDYLKKPLCLEFVGMNETLDDWAVGIVEEHVPKALRFACARRGYEMQSIHYDVTYQEVIDSIGGGDGYSLFEGSVMEGQIKYHEETESEGTRRRLRCTQNCGQSLYMGGEVSCTRCESEEESTRSDANNYGRFLAESGILAKSGRATPPRHRKLGNVFEEKLLSWISKHFSEIFPWCQEVIEVPCFH